MEESRLRGRPRLRLIDIGEPKKLQVRWWRRKALDREEWKAIVKKALVLHGP
ncbi:hypothetical protein O3M35_007745 [Rhynocoris fuscipes]|uniref:Uncharacterized protein n=1 Tax=Rhynocoris fuscipes TaxID=488301 RepID=A0AAW1DB43_9HEMI